MTTPVRLTPVPALDGLRAVAVTLVLLFHAGHLDGGFLGVDLFFALSGYLITALLMAEHAATGGVSVRAFWGRRARRLLPALALMLGITMVVIALVYGTDSVGANRDEALASMFYVSNWYSLHSPATFLTIFQHTWSLSIEAQFYALWPLVTWAILGRRARPDDDADDTRGARRLLVVTLVGAGLSAALMAVLHDGPETLARVSLGTDARLTPILLGAAVAAASRLVPSRSAGPNRALSAAGWVGLAGFLYLAFAQNRPDPALYEWRYAVCSVLAAALVGSVALTSGALTRVLEVAPLRLLGLISYGVYLWHWPVFYVLHAHRVGLTGWSLFGIQVAVTLAIAAASYVFVERPIRERRFTSGPKTV